MVTTDLRGDPGIRGADLAARNATRVSTAHQYRPDVDGLRALAVGAVVLFHAFPGTLPGGFLGVDIFFVISGFLITGLILEGVHAGTFTILGFYLRRVRRILPALLAMLTGISLLALLVLMPDELERFARNVTASALFVPNLMFARQTNYFDAATADNPLLHLWSLGVEEQFYLAWPVMLLLLARRVNARALVAGMVVLMVASFASQVLIARYDGTAAFYLPFTRFWQLLAGALLAALPFARGAATAATDTTRPRWRANVLSVTGGALMVGSIVATRAGQETVAGVGIPATLGAALFILAGPAAVLNRTLFSWRPVVYVGLISYPLYLWHWPPLSFLKIMEVTGDAGRALRIGAVAFAVLAAVATYRLVELPVRRHRDLRKLGVKLVSMLGVAAIAGVVIVLADGLPQRTSLAYNPFERTPEMRLQDRCATLYGQPQEWRKNTFCIRTDYERDPSIVVIGDSHSNMLMAGFRDSYPQASILQIGASACVYLRHTEFWNDNRRRWRELCPPIVAGAYRALTPDTRVVILSARVPMYTATPHEYAATFDFVSPKHFESSEFPGATPAEVFERSLARDLAELLAAGREVVLVQPVPPLDFSPRSCAPVRPIDRWLPARPESACTMPRVAVDARLATSREIVARVARSLNAARLRVVDPGEVLCDERVCRAVIGGTLMYRDDNHLSDEGARYVWSRIRPRDLEALADFERADAQQLASMH